MYMIDATVVQSEYKRDGCGIVFCMRCLHGYVVTDSQRTDETTELRKLKLIENKSDIIIQKKKRGARNSNWNGKR